MRPGIQGRAGHNCDAGCACAGVGASSVPPESNVERTSISRLERPACRIIDLNRATVPGICQVIRRRERGETQVWHVLLRSNSQGCPAAVRCRILAVDEVRSGHPLEARSNRKAGRMLVPHLGLNVMLGGSGNIIPLMLR